MRARGVEESLLFVTDGLTGIRHAISNVYPKARHQSCWVHLARNVSHAVRVKDRPQVLSDLKTVYTKDTLADAQDALNQFMNTWDRRYPKMIKTFKDNPSLFTFLSFPKQIRASIYTTNLIEGFNKNLKRYTKRKEQFPNEDSLIRFIGTYAGDYNQRFQMRIHKGFKLVTAELNEMFDNC